MKEPKRKELKTYEDNVLKTYENGCDDVKKYLKDMYPDAFPKEKTYKIGDRFKFIEGDTYILACTSDDNMALIGLDGLIAGGHWGYGSKTKNTKRVTEQELYEIIGYRQNDFTLIED